MTMPLILIDLDITSCPSTPRSFAAVVKPPTGCQCMHSASCAVYRVHVCRSARFVFISQGDLVYYLLGSGEYDELAGEYRQ